MPVPHMYYTNFDRAITEKYHVVLEGWPLEKFCSPSEIASRNEISILMASFESGATRFHKLSPTEFEKWSEDHSIGSTEDTGPLSSLSSPLPPSSLPLSPDSTPTHDPPASNTSQSSPLAGPQESIDGTGASAEMTTDSDPVTDPVNSENTPSSIIPAKRKQSQTEPMSSRQPLALTNRFINAGVTSANGSAVMVNAKVRKTRADKGKKRGPQAK
jgi:hypothetical protein